MRGKRGDFASLCLLLHDPPNHLGAEAGSPDSAGLIDRTKNNAGRNPGSSRPETDASFHPIRNGIGSYVAAFPNKIGNDRVFLPLLDALYPQRRQFCPV
jgi:hypothetical protein